MNSNRREFLALAGAASVAGFAGFNGGREAQPKDMSKVPLAGQRSAVAVVKAASYSKDLADAMLRGILECELDVAGKTVLLKPNFVEFDPNTCINTDVAVVAAALEVFRSLGAADVKIGEGPGHRRDTLAIAELTRYRSEIPKFDDVFVDLNRDDVTASPRASRAATRSTSRTRVLSADMIVSLAKMKTHHWAGATLSMKNFFGLVPGSIYGWPKNELHFIGIDNAIVELTRAFRAQEFRDRGWHRGHGRQRPDPGDSQAGGRAGDGFGPGGGGCDVLPHHGHRPGARRIPAEGGRPTGHHRRIPHRAARRSHRRTAHQL